MNFLPFSVLIEWFQDIINFSKCHFPISCVVVVGFGKYFEGNLFCPGKSLEKINILVEVKIWFLSTFLLHIKTRRHPCSEMPCLSFFYTSMDFNMDFPFTKKQLCTNNFPENFTLLAFVGWEKTDR